MMEPIWDKKEVEKAVRIIKGAKDKKSRAVRILDKIVYWLVLVIVVLGNVAVAIFLIPVLLVLKGFSLYFTVSFVSVAFGFFFDLLIRDIEKLEAKHHAIAGVVIPVAAIVSYYVIVKFVNVAAATIDNEHSLVLLGLVYAVFFMMPYSYNMIKNKR